MLRALAGSLALWTLLPATAAAQPLCNAGSGCSCNVVQCSCTNACDFECRSGTCDFTSPGSGAAQCQNNTFCTATFGGDGALFCEDGSTCQLTVTGAGSGRCNNRANCQVDLGPNSRFACAPIAGFTCSVTCEAPCVVTCGTGAGVCSVTCLAGSPLDCGGRVFSCGSCPPVVDGGAAVDGGVDGGAGVDAGEPDAGTDAGPGPTADGGDAGGDGGVRLAQRLAVGCSCSGAPGSDLLLACALVLTRKRLPLPARAGRGSG